MAKVIDHGWSTSSDEIPQPTSIIMGANLRKPSDEASKRARSSIVGPRDRATREKSRPVALADAR